MKFLLSILLVVLIGGCATSSKINGVQLGMSRADVVAVMGEPVSISAKGGAQYLNYALSETSDDAFYDRTTPYYVRLVDGEVDSYGRMGDFDSTQTPTVRIESDQPVKVDKNSDLFTELRKLKALHDDGIISDTEYDALKQKAIREY